MSVRKATSNIDQIESDFGRLLKGVLANRVPVDVLFENEIFRNRLRLITMAHARTEQDAEDLASDVSLKVLQKLGQFKPDFRHPYGGFFSWLRSLTRNTFFDTRRRSEVEFDKRPVENLDIADPHTDIESSLLYKEVLAEFEKSINALPLQQQLAIAYYLKGFTFREISDKMRQAGYRSTHVTVAYWIKEGLTAFFPESDQLQNIRSKNVSVTRLRATRAKREFYTILEEAINSGTAAITLNISRRLAAPAIKRKPLKPAQLTSRAGWRAANDLLRNMQSPESKQGIQAAFDASPEALGEAAVEQANKRRKVPVGSLTTFLMAASTANVVERVMNLSEDAA
ncbi:MAG: sigma-70 family RNA polymerase sigma factor [Pyrinomonadaceae bacterium]